MIYLDSAATTFQKPPAVAVAVAEALAAMSSPGRGGYPEAMRAADAAFDCRSELAGLYGLANPERVVFTLNATHALNIAIKSLVPPGGRAVVSGYEHNAVTRPLSALGAQVFMASAPLFSPEAAAEAFSRLIDEKTDAVICNHVSNVFGFIQPVEAVAESCGFKNPAAFSAIFKKRMGVTPTKYRSSVSAAYRERLQRELQSLCSGPAARC